MFPGAVVDEVGIGLLALTEATVTAELRFAPRRHRRLREIRRDRLDGT